MEALLNNLALVAKHDLSGLAQICGVDRADVLDMIAEIKALTPRPGASFAGDALRLFSQTCLSASFRMARSASS